MIADVVLPGFKEMPIHFQSYQGAGSPHLGVTHSFFLCYRSVHHFGWVHQSLLEFLAIVTCKPYAVV
jgi:hypothetical protein